ncbi:hypothetical protein SAMN05421819_3582 [Bryocella elongata]|uniref:Uncharacterized protein n=2 Tax=Bryocella elongata TaxID=863522 RepID=A0A1H6B867_9BACT|nr:hypothetical protein SAMN05421819_3582 [Bryocella elongata]
MAAVVMAVACCAPMAGLAQREGFTVRDPLFAGVERFAKNAVSVVQVEKGPVTLERAEGKGSDGRHGASDVYVYEFEKEGAYDPAEVKPYADRLGAQGWSCETLPSHRKPGAYRYKCRRPLADGYHESVDIVVEARQLVFVHGISNHEDNDSGDW